MLFHAKKHVTFILNTNKKLTRIRCLNPYLCCRYVLWLYVCLFAILTDTLALRHSYIFTIHRRTQSKFREANARLHTFFLSSSVSSSSSSSSSSSLLLLLLLLPFFFFFCFFFFFFFPSSSSSSLLLLRRRFFSLRLFIVVLLFRHVLEWRSQRTTADICKG